MEHHIDTIFDEMIDDVRYIKIATFFLNRSDKIKHK